MSVTWTAAEELARTSDDSEVRRRFNERNSVWVIVLLFFFGEAADDPTIVVCRML